MGRRRAFIAEEEDVVFDEEVLAARGAPDRWLLGTFQAHVEDDDVPALVAALDRPVAIREAIAWALVHADDVLIRDGDGRFYGIGAVPDEPVVDGEEGDAPVVPWRDELAATLVRRRPVAERWKDRTVGDPPIAWTVTAALVPTERIGEPWPLIADPAGTDARAAALIAAWAPDSWSDAEVVAHRRESRRARRSARLRSLVSGQHGYFVQSCPGWLLEWTVSAPTAEWAVDALRERLLPPPGWEVRLRAEPT